MKRFLLTPRAKRDVNDIWDYMGQQRMAAAQKKRWAAAKKG